MRFKMHQINSAACNVTASYIPTDSFWISNQQTLVNRRNEGDWELSFAFRFSISFVNLLVSRTKLIVYCYCWPLKTTVLIVKFIDSN